MIHPVMSRSHGNSFSKVLSLLCLAFVAGTIQAADKPIRLKVVTDRANALYDAGQQAKFLISITQAGQPVTDGKATYVVDDFITDGASKKFPQGELKLGDAPTAISVSLDQPGFLRCRVTYRPAKGKAIQATAGAGFSVTKIQRSLPVPDDFDEFWDTQKRQLAKVPAEAKLTPVEKKYDGLDCFDVQIHCLGGAPVSGYFAKPQGAKPKSLPAILWVHGAGVRSSSLGNAVKGATAGMLSMDINAHGIANGKPGKFYQDLSAGRLKNYRHDGRESRNTVYFRGMYLRLVRAIDFLTAQPEWDGKVLAVIGHSQGGGQALVAGGIDERVTFVATGVPAICDHSGRAAGRINGWPKIVPQGDDGKPVEKILKACQYVDAVNFASRCKAAAIMSVGFIDGTCPPSSCYAAYNSLLGDKEIINEPLMGHAAPQPIQKAFFDAVLNHVKRASGKP